MSRPAVDAFLRERGIDVAHAQPAQLVELAQTVALQAAASVRHPRARVLRAVSKSTGQPPTPRQLAKRLGIPLREVGVHLTHFRRKGLLPGTAPQPHVQDYVALHQTMVRQNRIAPNAFFVHFLHSQMRIPFADLARVMGGHPEEYKSIHESARSALVGKHRTVRIYPDFLERQGLDPSQLTASQLVKRLSDYAEQYRHFNEPEHLKFLRLLKDRRKKATPIRRGEMYKLANVSYDQAGQYRAKLKRLGLLSKSGEVPLDTSAQERESTAQTLRRAEFLLKAHRAGEPLTQTDVVLVLLRDHFGFSQNGLSELIGVPRHVIQSRFQFLKTKVLPRVEPL